VILPSSVELPLKAADENACQMLLEELLPDCALHLAKERDELACILGAEHALVGLVEEVRVIDTFSLPGG